MLYIHYLCFKKIEIMEVAIKKQTAFRLDSDLLDALKSAAKREHRSLNNFVECILREVVYTEPNEETKGSHCRSSCRQEFEEGRYEQL